MAKDLRIGIVGSGAIGSSLAKKIYSGFLKRASLCALFDINSAKSISLSRSLTRDKALAVASLDELIQKSDLVIEASQAACSWAIARRVLIKKRNIMIMSVGGIINRYSQLMDLAQRNGVKVYIPSGAIAGIDALKAANLGKIRSVTLTTYKNPKSFKGVGFVEKKGIKLLAIKQDRLLFSGSAKEAVKHFPQNINVAAILSIAGIGDTKTRVRIVASPKAKRNIHEIKIVSESGSIFTRTENVLHPDNPKTSYLAYLSAVAKLKDITEPVKVGT